jgi:hypothetical protein
VRKVLTEAAQAGLPGEHHFYIAFDTAAPGVRISSRIRQKYPEEMTIVLQHQFWDFIVSDTHFEVSLSFGGIPERLVVPFTAVKGFFDPSVQFGLQFDPARDRDAVAATSDGAAAAVEGPKPSLASSEGRKVGGEKAPARASVPATAGPKAVPATAKVEDGKTSAGKPSPGKPSADKPEADAAKPESAAEEPAAGAAVVSLDAFRKKT